MSIKLEKLREFYTDYLACLGFTVTDTGAIGKQNDDGEPELLVCNDMPVVFPNEAILSKASDAHVVFNPLSESLLLGESPVINSLKEVSMVMLQDMVAELVTLLLKFSQNEEIVSSLSPKQVEWFKCTNGADATTLKNWQSLCRRFQVQGSSNRVITLFLQRGAELNGETYKRLCVARFSLYEAFEKDNIVYGVKFRKSDVAVIKSILQAIFPKIEEADAYSIGSNSMVAPYFEALVKTYIGLVDDLKTVFWNFRKHIPHYISDGSFKLPTQVVERLPELDAWRDVLPVMPYNDGDRKDKRDKQQVKQPEQQAVPAPVQQQPAPAPQPQPAFVPPAPQPTQGNPYATPSTPAFPAPTQTQPSSLPFQTGWGTTSSPAPQPPSFGFGNGFNGNPYAGQPVNNTWVNQQPTGFPFRY